eukprot:COSAG02_NODE_3861_length_6130_cov_16.333112_4_plen_102_part_00
MIVARAVESCPSTVPRGARPTFSHYPFQFFIITSTHDFYTDGLMMKCSSTWALGQMWALRPSRAPGLGALKRTEAQSKIVLLFEKRLSLFAGRHCVAAYSW